MIISLKNKVLLFFNSSSSITYILLNNSNIAISVTMSSSLNRTFILTGCPSKVVCVYDMTSFTQMKW